jgi:hypothetical protein
MSRRHYHDENKSDRDRGNLNNRLHHLRKKEELGSSRFQDNIRIDKESKKN